MRTVKLTKVTQEHVRALQIITANYALDFKPFLGRPHETNDFVYSISDVDISHRLILSFRSKIESSSLIFTLSLKASEAVTLFNACSNARITTDDDFVAHVAEIYKNEIDQQFKSLISPADTITETPLLIK